MQRTVGNTVNNVSICFLFFSEPSNKRFSRDLRKQAGSMYSPVLLTCSNRMLTLCKHNTQCPKWLCRTQQDKSKWKYVCTELFLAGVSNGNRSGNLKFIRGDRTWWLIEQANPRKCKCSKIHVCVIYCTCVFVIP